MWNLPGPGIEPVSPGFLSTGPPEKSQFCFLMQMLVTQEFSLRLELCIDLYTFLHPYSISINVLTCMYMPRTEAGSHCLTMLIEASLNEDDTSLLPLQLGMIMSLSSS